MALLTPDLEPLWIARYDYRPGWRLPLHAHAHYFQLIWIIGGAGEALIGDARVPLQPQQLLFFRPGLRHGLEIAAQSSVRTLDTKFRIHRSSLRHACHRLDAVHLRADPRVSTLLEALHAEAQQHGRWVNEISQTLLTQVLLLLLKHDPAPALADVSVSLHPSAEPSLCDRLHRFLFENCAGRIDQRVLSDSLHYSYRHLHTVWRTRHEESPLQALWQYRVERAKKMIRYSDYELKRIAELSGFTTIHHFTRVFTRIAGASPARWRERERHSIRRDIIIRRGFINQPLTIQTARARTAKPSR